MFVLSRTLLLGLSLASYAAAQAGPAAQRRADIRVAAAADLTDAMRKLAAAFENKTGIHVEVSLGSSGNFFAQIQNGAPFDVFLSADRGYPEKLERAGQGEAGSVVSYARGKLVLWQATGQASPVTAQDLADGNLDALASPAVRKIAIANPAHAPYGRASVAALEHYKIYDRVKGKLVLGENISQTAQFGQSGNAGVVFLSLSLATSDAMQHAGQWLLLPQESYPPIDQAAVIIKTSAHKAEAWHFVRFLTSTGGQAILRNFGFGAPAR